MTKTAIRLAASVAFWWICSGAQVTYRASMNASGEQGDLGSFAPSISADGRFVAFSSYSHNLVPGDLWQLDVFLRDHPSGIIQRVSDSIGGGSGNGWSYSCCISADGAFVAFDSDATDLVLGDVNGWGDVFIWNRQSDLTEIISVNSAGRQGNSGSGGPVLSADGRYVAFVSVASNLVAGDVNGFGDVFLRDRLTGTTEIVSVSSAGVQADAGFPSVPCISGDGRYVGFASVASTLVGGDDNGVRDVFVRDRQSATTQVVSVSSLGVLGNGPSEGAAIALDGSVVAFHSLASNLVIGDTDGFHNVFIRDLQMGVTEMGSIAASGGAALGGRPSISSNGRLLAFETGQDIVPGDTNGQIDIFVRDRVSRTTERVSISSEGIQSNDLSIDCAISGDGRWVAFMSDASTLVPGDTNLVEDVFVHDRDYAVLISLCDPGDGGVITCPCANPPGGPDRGCDNSSATGGASLSAGGVAYLSMDSLEFTSNGERPTAFSLLLQGTATISSGLAYGQGVRCVGGSLKRLFTGNASGGSVTMPNFGAGEPTVSARSASKGDPIQPGQSRWYLVYYRDPNVLGGCPSGSTFNATQTGQVLWSL